MREFLYIDPACQALLRLHGLDRVDALLACTNGQRLDKPGLEPWRQRWRLSLCKADGSPATFYLKRFERPPLRRQWTRWREGALLHGTGYVEWSNARLLAERGIPAVTAVAVGERLAGPLERASFVLLKEVEGDSLERLAGRLDAASQRPDAAVLTALARSVARFHQTGFVHRDLYLCHLFRIAGRAGRDIDDYVMIDLQRVFRPRWRRRRWMVKDLAALAVSTPSGIVGPLGRLRFLARYCQARGNSGGVRSLAASVAGRLARMKRHVPRRRGSAPASATAHADSAR